MLSIKDKNIYYLIGLGLFVRLLIFSIFYTNITIFPDSSGYLELTQRINDLNLTGYSGERSPGYPLLIALGFGNLYLVVLYQMILGIATSVFWYKSLLRLKFSAKQSLIISVFLSTLLNVIFFETAILVESFVLFLFSILIYQQIKNYFRETNFKDELVVSALLGLLCLVKPFYAFLPFLFCGIYMLRNFSFQNILNKKILIFIFPLIAYFGWSYVNKLNTGYFVSTTFFGLNTAQNCVRFAEKAPKEYLWISKPYVKYRETSIQEDKDIAMSIWYAYNSGAFNEYDLGFNELSAKLGDFAKATIQENPWDYMHQVIFYSWKDFWKPVIYWNYDEFNLAYANKVFLAVWYLQYAFLLMFRFLFLFLIPYFIATAIKERKISIALFLSLVVLSASILQALVTYGTNNRFSFPFEFIMVFVVLIFLKNKAYFFNLKDGNNLVSTRKNNTFNV